MSEAWSISKLQDGGFLVAPVSELMLGGSQIRVGPTFAATTLVEAQRYIAKEFGPPLKAAAPVAPKKRGRPTGWRKAK